MAIKFSDKTTVCNEPHTNESSIIDSTKDISLPLYTLAVYGYPDTEQNKYAIELLNQNLIKGYNKFIQYEYKTFPQWLKYGLFLYIYSHAALLEKYLSNLSTNINEDQIINDLLFRDNHMRIPPLLISKILDTNANVYDKNYKKKDNNYDILLTKLIDRFKREMYYFYEDYFFNWKKQFESLT